MSKESTKEALDRYFTKQARASLRPKRQRNSRPEKRVEQECLVWMRAQGWDVQIYEAKGNFNPLRNRYMAGSMKAGTVDCQGVTPNGQFVAVEFKAPKKRATLNLSKNCRQREYLMNKIKSNAFGCVVDSVAQLQKIWDAYSSLEPQFRQAYLMTQLP
jgi:hypothetical protein